MNPETKLPSNIKQIGTIPDGFRIYMEDYASTYINQCAREAGCEEKIAALIGESCTIGGNEVLFISGIIPAENEDELDSVKIFSQKDIEYINEQKDIYFSSLKTVGWLYIQPGFGERLSERQINCHRQLFPSYNQVMLVVDPLEDICTFYNWQKTEGGISLAPIKGYIIYYDKNEGMSRFITDHKKAKTDSEEFQQRQKESDEKIRRAAMKSLTAKSSKKRYKSSADLKRLVNIFGSLSAVLFLVCFVMGTQLVKNDDRLKKIEQQLASVDNSYKYIVSAIKDNNVQSVFAQTSPTTETEAQSVFQVQTEAQTEAQTETQTQTEMTTVQTTEQASQAFSDAQPKKRIKADSYTVQKGDTLGQISRTVYGSSSMMDEIMQANNITDADKIRVGDTLIMP